MESFGEGKYGIVMESKQGKQKGPEKGTFNTVEYKTILVKNSWKI